MRKVFLIVGITCTLAAFTIIFRSAKENPFSRRGPRRAYKEAHQGVTFSTFSPNGAHLAFLVNDDSGEFHKTTPYLYSLKRKTVTRLNTDADGYVSGPLYWANDSRRLGYNEAMPIQQYLHNGRVINVETNTVEEKFNIFFLGWSPDGEKQLFHNLYTNEVFVKEVGEPAWSVLPKRLGEGRDVYAWGRRGRSFVYSDTMHDIQEYRLEEGVVKTVGLLGDYSIKGFLYPSPSTDAVYFLNSRTPAEGARGVVVWKIDLRREGGAQRVYDSGLDQENEYISRIFFGPNDNPMYLVLNKKSGRDLVRLDTATKKTETVFTGEFAAWDYSSERDLVAITLSEDKHRTLYLLDVRTGQTEQIFPPR